MNHADNRYRNAKKITGAGCLNLETAAFSLYMELMA
jgi:hypothetical protein